MAHRPTLAKALTLAATSAPRAAPATTSPTSCSPVATRQALPRAMPSHSAAPMPVPFEAEAAIAAPAAACRLGNPASSRSPGRCRSIASRATRATPAAVPAESRACRPSRRVSRPRTAAATAIRKAGANAADPTCAARSISGRRPTTSLTARPARRSSSERRRVEIIVWIGSHEERGACPIDVVRHASRCFHAHLRHASGQRSLLASKRCGGWRSFSRCHCSLRRSRGA